MNKQEALELFKKTLATHNYSVTNVRQLVFGLLWGAGPQSMRQLNAAAGGAIDRVSLYRTINLFERLAIVQRITIGWKYKVEMSELFVHHHHHITCSSCGQVASVFEHAGLERIIQKLTYKHDFSHQAHQLEITGLCNACQTKSQT